MTQYLGIDIGTSAVKLCLTDEAGQVTGSFGAPLDTQHPFPGASEQHPQAWYDALRTALRDVPPELRAGIVAVGLSGQMHSAVLLDEDKAPIRPAILWNDGRSEAECRAIMAAGPDIGQIASLPAMPGFTAPKLLWLKQHAAQEWGRIRHVLLPKDYIGFRLHGALVTDYSDAAGTHWLNQEARTWSDALCEISATHPEWLPRLCLGSEIAGYIQPDAAADLGLPAGVPVAAGAGDAAAGAVGIGAIAAGDGFISLGTSGQLFVTTDRYRPNPDSLIHTYAHTVPDRWFQMACMLNGARPMAWLSEMLNQPIAELLRGAETSPSGPLFLPYLTGERTPHGDTDIRAGFWGLGEATTPAMLMRAVVEAIAFSFADASEALAQAGTRPETLMALGGGTQSDLVLQMIADILGTPVGRSDAAAIGPALGAARLAMAAVGPAEIDAVATKPTISRWFEPNTEAQTALAPRLAGFRALYHASKSVQSAVTGAALSR